MRERWRGKRKRVIIPAKWLSIAPSRPLKFWIQVVAEARKRRVQKHDYAQVFALVCELTYGVSQQPKPEFFCKCFPTKGEHHE